MPVLPDDFPWTLDQTLHLAGTMDGWLSKSETELLAILAACPTTSGEILEIGCYHGKSTYVLAKTSQLVGDGVVTVDPLPGVENHDQFQANLKRGGIADRVEFHRMKSSELAGSWNRPLRLLWIDGNHSYMETRRDFDSYLPWLADGGMIAMHDVLHEYEGPVRVFAEDVLLSRHFGAAGISGSIGWAQYHHNPGVTGRHVADKLRLYRKLKRLVPFVAFDGHPRGISRFQYKMYRSQVPHGGISPARWLQKVA